jgi:hypothetical protein
MIIHSFSSVEIDGVDVGDCFSAISNYPNQAAAILAALASYEQGLIAASVPVTAPSIDPGQIAGLQQQISQLQATISQQQNQLSQHVITDWPGLQKDLLEASLAGLLAEIVSIARATENPPGENLEAEALALIGAIGAAVQTGDRVTVIEAYQALLGHPTNGAGFVPKLLGINPAAAPGLMGLIATTMPNLQAVLDDRGIPSSLLKFAG